MNILMPLFSPSTGTWGSLTRLTALANKFITEGHIVAFCASGKMKESLTEKGFSVYSIPETTILGLPKWISDIFQKRAVNSSPPVREGKSFGNIWLLYFFIGYGNRKTLTNIIQAEMEAVKDLNADLIVTEMELGAYITSYILDIPLVTTYAKVAEKGRGTFFFRTMNNVIRRSINAVDKRKINNIDEIAFGKECLKLVPSIPHLDSTDPEREDVCYTGNLLEPVGKPSAVFAAETGKKYIFCYFGTGSIPLDNIRKVLPEALSGRGDIVCYTASQSIEKSFSIGNVNFVSYVPAEKILPCCIAVICHGGLNTITQSLEAGVPLIMFPGPIFERRYNAQQVESLRCGYMGELSDFNAEWLRKKLREITKLEKNIHSVQKEFQRYNGTETAYNRIMDWMQKK